MILGASDSPVIFATSILLLIEYVTGSTMNTTQY